MKKFPFFKQADSRDCGPTCLRIISKFYGNSCQGLIVPSNKTKDALIHYGLKQKNIYTIPTGLELERFSVNNKNN